MALLAAFLVGATGCELFPPDEDQVFVRLRNDGALGFSAVVLDLGEAASSHIVFDELASSQKTPYRPVRQAHSAPYTVRARLAEGDQGHRDELRYDLEAVVPVRLEPGRYTYGLRVDAEGRLAVTLERTR